MFCGDLQKAAHPRVGSRVASVNAQVRLALT